MALLPRLSNDLSRLLCESQGVPGALKQLHRVNVHLPECLHATHVLEDVHADRESGCSKPLLLGACIYYGEVHLWDKVKGCAHGQMVDIDVI